MAGLGYASWRRMAPETHERRGMKQGPRKSDAKPAGKNPHAAALGRLGGLKGGRARAEALTPEERQKIASNAARARWRGKDN
jgi:hypothetical protein